jgi:hypothetical protein
MLILLFLLGFLFGSALQCRKQLGNAEGNTLIWINKSGARASRQPDDVPGAK